MCQLVSLLYLVGGIFLMFGLGLLLGSGGDYAYFARLSIFGVFGLLGFFLGLLFLFYLLIESVHYRLSDMQTSRERCALYARRAEQNVVGFVFGFSFTRCGGAVFLDILVAAACDTL